MRKPWQSSRCTAVSVLLTQLGHGWANPGSVEGLAYTAEAKAGVKGTVRAIEDHSGGVLKEGDQNVLFFKKGDIIHVTHTDANTWFGAIEDEALNQELGVLRWERKKAVREKDNQSAVKSQQDIESVQNRILASAKVGYFPAEYVERISEAVPYRFSRDRVPKWSASDIIDIYYSKLVLGTWAIPGKARRWNIYHAAIGFVNNGTGEKTFFEGTPVNTDDARNIIFPKVTENLWRQLSWHPQKVPFTWTRDAYVKYHNSWPQHFTRWVKLGRTSGEVFDQYVDWLEKDISTKIHTHLFDPDTLLVKPRRGEARKFFMGRTCMEFCR